MVLSLFRTAPKLPIVLQAVGRHRFVERCSAFDVLQYYFGEPMLLYLDGLMLTLLHFRFSGPNALDQRFTNILKTLDYNPACVFQMQW